MAGVVVAGVGVVMPLVLAMYTAVVAIDIVEVLAVL